MDGISINLAWTASEYPEFGNTTGIALRQICIPWPLTAYVFIQHCQTRLQGPNTDQQITTRRVDTQPISHDQCKDQLTKSSVDKSLISSPNAKEMIICPADQMRCFHGFSNLQLVAGEDRYSLSIYGSDPHEADDMAARVQSVGQWTRGIWARVSAGDRLFWSIIDYDNLK